MSTHFHPKTDCGHERWDVAQPWDAAQMQFEDPQFVCRLRGTAVREGGASAIRLLSFCILWDIAWSMVRARETQTAMRFLSNLSKELRSSHKR